MLCIYEYDLSVFNWNNYTNLFERMNEFERCLSGGMSAYVVDVYCNVVTTMTRFFEDTIGLLLSQVIKKNIFNFVYWDNLSNSITTSNNGLYNTSMPLQLLFSSIVRLCGFDFFMFCLYLFVNRYWLWHGYIMLTFLRFLFICSVNRSGGGWSSKNSKAFSMHVVD